MKISKKQFFKCLLSIIVAILLFFIGCCSLNFILVPPALSTIIEVVMKDVKNQTENIDIFFCGSSRTYRSINSVALSNKLNKNVFNIAYENSNYYSTYYLLNEIFKKNNPEKIFLEVSTTNFTREESTENLFIYRTLTGKNKTEFAKGLELNYFESNLFDFTNHLNNFSNERFLRNIKIKFSNNPNLGDTISDSRTIYLGNGFMVAKYKAIDNEYSLPLSYFTNGMFWHEDFVNQTQMEYFIKILELCKNNNVEVILYSPPYPYSIIEKHYDSFSVFDSFVESLATENNVEYYGFSKIKKEFIELVNDYFYDAVHCTENGANALQPVIKNMIEKIELNDFTKTDWFYQNYSEMIEDYNKM